MSKRIISTEDKLYAVNIYLDGEKITSTINVCKEVLEF